MSKLEARYLKVLFLSNLARTIPHAVLSIILLVVKQIPFEGIALTQIFFYVAVIIFEIPSGILSDKGQRKFLYVGSLLMLLLGYVIIFLGNSLFILCIGWFVYGIASALSSGNIEGYIVKTFKENGEIEKIKEFNINLNYVVFISSSVGAIIGSFLYQLIGIKMYLISIIIFMCCVIYTIKTFDMGEEKVVDWEKIKYSLRIKKNINSMITFVKLINKRMLINIAFVISFVLFFQPFYQYWQILYKEKGIPVLLFGVIYVLNNCISIASNKIYSKYSVKRSNMYIISLVFLIIIFVSLMYLEGLLYVIFISFALCLVNILDVFSRVSLMEIAEEGNISTLISVTSTLSRIAGIGVLFCLSILIRILNVNTALLISFILFGVTIIFINFFYKGYSNN